MNIPVLLMIAGAGLQVADVVSNGAVFGPTGALSGINAKVPSVSIGGYQSNLAFWLIAIGGVWYFVKREA